VLWAVILDNSRIPFLGKRKGFIVLSTSLACVLTFTASFWIASLIQHNDYTAIGALGIIIMLLMTFIQISADGWVVDYIAEENTCYAALCRIFGNHPLS
jgi:hypothetical protein